jgi:diacylglycerol kinase (ATP)
VARETVLIVNGRARLGAQGAEQARAALQGAGFEISRFHVAKKRSEFERQLDRSLREKAPLIAIGGGDGTQRSAAARIAGTDSTMMVVPLGTGNAWARDLGIPVSPVEMASALAKGEVRRIDVGVVNGEAFVNVATVGVTSLIVKNLSDPAKGRLGRLAYFPAVVRSVLQVRPFRLRVESDESCFEGEALLFVAAAGRTHAGPFAVTKDAENDDGLLSLYALHGSDWRGLLRFGYAMLRGRHTALEEVWCCETARARVTARPRRRSVVDGERGPRTPLELSVRAGSLRVLVPRT